ncbi:hypothetical protein J2T60_002230 [Natronospira proteinivora]|uniref:Uncharacterized protein n=1 Tax=Natronospira proteinivora TaxID=1807133 RepID=A0ABT1GBC7_9GAMM|nr:hypothetical protein [Natronospira proteinivora]
MGRIIAQARPQMFTSRQDAERCWNRRFMTLRRLGASVAGLSFG